MATYASNITPRLRMSRHSPVHYDRNSPVASTSDAGPSRLSDFSRLIGMNLKDTELSDDLYLASEQDNMSKVSAPSTSSRSENPAAVLRALLSRLPAHPPSPTQAQDPSLIYASERESDYDMSESEPMQGAPSIAQESLKDIFSKALRDPGDTPQKNGRRRNSIDTSEVEASPRVAKERANNKGKRRSLSDDEVEKTEYPGRTETRSKIVSQPITMEFLRERFSSTPNSRASVKSGKSPSSSSNHDSSNDTATILRDLNSSQATPPAATSTPQQSLRMSTNSQFQFQSNLLDQDMEMQHAVEGVDSFEENFVDQSGNAAHVTVKARPSNTLILSIVSPSLKVQGRPVSRNENEDQMSPKHTPMPSIKPHARQGLRPSYGKTFNDEYSRSNHRPSPLQRPRSFVQHDASHNSQSRLDPAHYDNSRLSPIPHARLNRHQSFSSSRGSSPSGSSRMSMNHDDEPIDILHERERNWNSPRPVWHKPPASPTFKPTAHLHGSSSLSPPPATSSPPQVEGRSRANSFRNTKELKEQHSIHHRKPNRASFLGPDSGGQTQPTRPLSPLPTEQSSPTPNRVSSLQHADSSYLLDDSKSRHHPPRSPSPSFSKKSSGSPHTTNNPNNFKKPSPTLPSRGQRGVSPFRSQREDLSGPQGHSMTTTPRRKSSSASNHSPQLASSAASSPSNVARIASPKLQQEHVDRNEETETDDMRETDFSSQDYTPDVKTLVPSSNTLGGRRSRSRTPPRSDDLMQETIVPTTPRIFVQDHTPPRDAYQELPASPSTPPRRPTSRNSMAEFKDPAPSNTLPDLPTPSSSDESDGNPQFPRATPKMNENEPQNPIGMATPRLPGGWMNTPKPPRDFVRRGGSVPGDDLSQNFPTESQLATYDGLETPRRNTGENNFHSFTKTPKPPGGWLATKIPTSPTSYGQQDEDSQSEIGQNQGLLTPVASLSKGSMLDPKTPAVPGAWATTPAARRSILKVRFNPETPSVQDKGYDNAEDIHPFSDVKDADIDDARSSSQVQENSFATSPPSPRSPRRVKSPNIRVLDAFGREREPTPVQEIVSQSRSMIGLDEAKGHEVDETKPLLADQSKADAKTLPVDRKELLSHIRHGLDELASDFDSTGGHRDGQETDYNRIEELNAISRRARHIRERLHSQKSESSSRNDFSSDIADSGRKASWLQVNPRMYLALLLFQLLLFWLIYRISMFRAQEYFLTSYYDPFNPELHSNLFRTWNSLTAALHHESWANSAGRFWDTCLQSITNLPSHFYIWDFTTFQKSNSTSTWTPT
ncbi:hypothetical protein B0H34DRAFT_673022 [Crassisporium funariophilum]|nr:hypothetical protein B0H34DRAFT_673022 [Crassisporium funariophilum]